VKSFNEMPVHLHSIDSRILNEIWARIGAESLITQQYDYQAMYLWPQLRWNPKWFYHRGINAGHQSLLDLLYARIRAYCHNEFHS
jgi:hypothetical protein